MIEEKKEWGIVLFLIFLCVAFFGVFFMMVTNEMEHSPYISSWGFCEDQEYDTSRMSYIPYKNQDYGKVVCSVCYAEGCEEKSFNVTPSGWGVFSNLKEVEVKE